MICTCIDVFRLSIGVVFLEDDGGWRVLVSCVAGEESLVPLADSQKSVGVILNPEVVG